jgi:hypothetical protein
MGFTAIVYIVIPPAKKFELVTKVGTAALSPSEILAGRSGRMRACVTTLKVRPFANWYNNRENSCSV